MPSARLEDYDLGAVLGVGTVGTIYSATRRQPTGDAKFDRVAIKRLHPAISRDPLIRARFRREMTILERLGHPHIVAYHGGGEADGQLYYIMELVDGGTVKEILESSGPLPWPVVVEITRQICSALQCAHNHGVIHRDLKPGNLFLTRDARVKLGDFGIARDLHGGDLTAQGMTVGTHAYMPPEQITGSQDISGKSDLYSLGCCLFELLTGRKPFIAEDFAHLFDQHLRADPPSVRRAGSDCPAELDELIRQLMAKRPEDRPFNARQVQGVMLQLGERYGLGDPDGGGEAGGDVGAAHVTLAGRRLLEKQIHARLQGPVREDVGWLRLGLLVAGLIAVAVLAAMSTR